MCLLTFSILPCNAPKKHIHKITALLPSMTLQVKPALWRLKYMNGVLMPSVTFHGEMSHSAAAAAQQADSIKIGFPQRLMPCMQYATAFGYSPQGLAIKSAVFYHLKNVLQYSKGELGRGLRHRLGSGVAHCLHSPPTTTTKNNQQPSALGFDFSSPRRQMFGLARAAVVSAIPRDGAESRCQRAAARSPSGTIDRPQEGPCEGGAGLVLSRATADKSPAPINGHPPVECTREGFLCSHARTRV